MVRSMSLGVFSGPFSSCVTSGKLHDSVSLPFLLSSMTIIMVPASQVAVSINEIMHNKE